MQNPAVDFDIIVRQFTSGLAWWQLGVVAAGFALSWFLARLIRARLPDDLQPGAFKIGAGSVHRLVLPLLALIFVWWGSFALSRWQPVPLLHIAIPMIASFVVIRLVVYLLRHVIPPSPALKASERIIAYGVWGIVAFYLTGVLPEISTALDEISFLVGTKKISVLLILHAIFWSVFTVFVSLAISRIIEKRLMAASSLDMSMRVFAGKIIRALAVLLAILIALPLVGIDITVLSVFGGALGVGLGLGLQKIASNYVSGFVILLDRSIRPGDLVTIGDRLGVVADIKARYTVLRGADGTEAIIPNDSIISNTVLNHTYSDTKGSVKTAVTISYDCDVKQAMDLLLAAGVGQARVLKEPQPAVLVKMLGDNGIDLELITWIKDPELGQALLRSDILLETWRSFRENGIGVPYPQREVRVIGNPLLPASPET
ncbi:MAG: mechanosensitive ion channel domain-containing protein [Betaproteobacteria bacterium]